MWEEVWVWFVFGFERKRRVELFEVEVMFGQMVVVGWWRQRKEWTSCIWKETQAS